MNEDLIENTKTLASSVSEQINYDFFDYYLIKPMDRIKVKKEFSTPIPSEKQKKDDVDATDYDEVKTEIVEVDSDFRKGVILKLPKNYKGKETNDEMKGVENIAGLEVGSIILFRDKAGVQFDLLKDSVLVKHWDILAVVNG